MKKGINYELFYPQRQISRRFLKIMKINLLFLLIGISNVFASTYSQSTELSLDIKDAVVEEVFEEIQKQSEYIFFYKDSHFKSGKKFTIKADNVGIDNIMEELLSGTDLDYEISDRQIIITPRQEEAPGSSPTLKPDTAVIDQIEISGQVSDAVSGEPLIGATIQIRGTTEGTITDVTGNYSIQVPGGESVLVFSYIGFEPREVRVEALREINIALNENIERIDEVLVIGYGTQKRSSSTAAVASVGVEELQKAVSHDVALALQGRTAGLQVLTDGGIAGADINIIIRGAASFGSVDPLYVIDGAFSNLGLRALNPEDIESIEILKDGAAAAIYGSRAANGVVLITTKSGQMGKTVVDFNSSYSIQNPSRTLEYMNAEEWRSFANQVSDNSGLARASENVNPTYPEVNTDWQDLFLQYAPIYNASLGISGGSENSSYNASIGYYDQTGMITYSDYTRYSARLNTTYKKGRLSIHESFALARMEKTPTNSFNIGIPTAPAYDENGRLHSAGREYYIEGDNNVSNPLASTHYSNRKSNTSDVTGSINLGIDLSSGFEYVLSLSGAYDVHHDYNHSPEYYTRWDSIGNPITETGNPETSLSEARGEELTFNIDNLIKYVKTFEAHSIDALIGTSWLQEFNRVMSIGTVYDLGDPTLTGVNADGKIAAGEYNAALLSVFARLNYQYDNRYLFSTTIRRDESSKFHKDYRVGWFPSVSAGWNIHREAFFPGGVVSRLKVRGSYGELGANFIEPYLYISQAYGPIPAVFGKLQTSPKDRQMGRVTRIAQQGLTWETSVSKDLGLELGFFENRFLIIADYFIKTNVDLLAKLEASPSSGQTLIINKGERPAFNSASVENKGFEFDAIYKDRTGDFTYDISFNFTTIKNKVLSLGANVQPIRGELISGSFNDRPTITKEGLPIGSFIGYVIEGLDGNGNFIFQDNNGLDPNGNLTNAPDSAIDENDKVILGNPQPDFTFGLNFSAGWKNFDLTIFLQGTYGNEIFSRIRYPNYFEYNNNNVADALNAWTPTNTNTDIPIMHVNNRTGGNSLPSEFYIEDGSFLRVKNLQLGYSLSSKILSRIKVSRLRFYAGAQNLLTLTNYTGYDPEVSSDALFNRGVDFRGYPNARTYTFGLNLSF